MDVEAVIDDLEKRVSALELCVDDRAEDNSSLSHVEESLITCLMTIDDALSSSISPEGLLEKVNMKLCEINEYLESDISTNVEAKKQVIEILWPEIHNYSVQMEKFKQLLMKADNTLEHNLNSWHKLSAEKYNINHLIILNQIQSETIHKIRDQMKSKIQYFILLLNKGLIHLQLIEQRVFLLSTDTK